MGTYTCNTCVRGLRPYKALSSLFRDRLASLTVKSVLFRNRITMALIRLCGCVGWSASLFLHTAKSVFLIKPFPVATFASVCMYMAWTRKKGCGIFEPRHEIYNNVVYATSKTSDQPAHMRSLIRTFASRLNIL